ncbi:MAG: hypothetical protein EXR93_07960 [Gemmatimonadetes bacterium]|nr:hypothetical protein [Gemmatimonadota bacterium]
MAFKYGSRGSTHHIVPGVGTHTHQRALLISFGYPNRDNHPHRFERLEYLHLLQFESGSAGYRLPQRRQRGPRGATDLAQRIQTAAFNAGVAAGAHLQGYVRSPFAAAGRGAFRLDESYAVGLFGSGRIGCGLSLV